MKRTLFLICTALAAGGCRGSSESDSSSPPKDTTGSTSSSNPSTVTLANRPAESRPAENRPAESPATLNAPVSSPDQRAAGTTSMDERDRSGAPYSSGDQGALEADRRITREIHEAILDDPSMSAMAQEIQITIKDGVVTLRGPVQSRQEKAQVAAAAQRVSGITRIDNRLDIVSVSP